jgi:2-phospho-L-lactate guanylyltransferase
MNAILVPVKTMSDAKGRLADYLSADDRHRLGLAMLSDVLTATVTWRSWVVTSDDDASKLAEELGCAVVRDAGTGLNDAIRLGTTTTTAEGATGLLVLPADVPLVESDDVARAFQVDAEVAVAVSADGGTNALLRRPPGVIDPHFGPDSARLHIEAAQAAGLSVETLDLPSLQVDVDRQEDLEAVAASELTRGSVVFARELLSR